MEGTLLTEKEKERLAKLYSYDVVKDYKKTGIFQHVVAMAAHIFNVPLAFVNFVDKKVVIAESCVGLDGVNEFDRSTALCSQAVLQDKVTVFEDVKAEPCLAGNPLVHDKLGLQFYAAASIKTPDGFNIGVVAIADTSPRAFSEEDGCILESLASIVIEELEERRYSMCSM